MSIIDVEFPKTLFVIEETVYLDYILRDMKHLVGKHDLASAVPDNDKTNTVATYVLVSVDKYKKTVTRTETVAVTKE